MIDLRRAPRPVEKYFAPSIWRKAPPPPFTLSSRARPHSGRRGILFSPHAVRLESRAGLPRQSGPEPLGSRRSASCLCRCLCSGHLLGGSLCRSLLRGSELQLRHKDRFSPTTASAPLPQIASAPPLRTITH